MKSELERLNYLKDMYEDITERIFLIKKEIKGLRLAQHHIKKAISSLNPSDDLVKSYGASTYGTFRYGEVIDLVKSIVSKTNGMHARAVIESMMIVLREKNIVNDDNERYIKKEIDPPVRSSLYTLHKKGLIAMERTDRGILWKGLIINPE